MSISGYLSTFAGMVVTFLVLYTTKNDQVAYQIAGRIVVIILITFFFVTIRQGIQTGLITIAMPSNSGGIVQMAGQTLIRSQQYKVFKLETTNPVETKPPLPPFTLETAKIKVQAAESAWNTRDPERVVLAYTEDSQWRNRTEFFRGREQIKAFLKRKWAKELDYRLKKELWSFTENRISVCFEYEWHDEQGYWYRAYGNEQWEFAENGLMQKREASINDLPIQEFERKLRWERTSSNTA